MRQRRQRRSEPQRSRFALREVRPARGGVEARGGAPPRPHARGGEALQEARARGCRRGFTGCRKTRPRAWAWARPRARDEAVASEGQEEDEGRPADGARRVQHERERAGGGLVRRPARSVHKFARGGAEAQAGQGTARACLGVGARRGRRAARADAEPATCRRRHGRRIGRGVGHRRLRGGADAAAHGDGRRDGGGGRRRPERADRQPHRPPPRGRCCAASAAVSAAASAAAAAARPRGGARHPPPPVPRAVSPAAARRRRATTPLPHA